MQITVKEVKVLKTGTNQYGDWKLVKVYTDKEEYTTLANDADQITKGSTINITDMDEDEKGKKFKKFEIVAGGEKSEPSSASQPNDNEYWERKQAIERASIEAQVAFKGMVELFIADKLGEDEQNATLGWAMGRIDLPAVIVTKIKEAKSETIKDNKATVQQEEGLGSKSTGGEALELLPGESERVRGFLERLIEHNIQAPRLFLEVEYAIPQSVPLSNTQCELLYKTIKTREKW